MDFNFVTNLESCNGFIDQNYYLSLAFYSHALSAFAALFFAAFVFLKNKKDIASWLFLFVTCAFSFWSFSDIVLWTSADSRRIMFFWSIINIFGNLVSLSVLYFSYVFLEKKDAPGKYKFIAILLSLPFILLSPTSYNLPAFGVDLCEPVQGPLIYYFYFLELVFFLWLLSYLGLKIISLSGVEKRKCFLFSSGTVLFLLFFSGSNIIASILAQWQVLNYGLFGMVFLTGFLAYLIVRYQVFNIKLLAAQALVISLAILIGAQLFFIEMQVNFILTSITFLLVVVFGIMLIRSVRSEIRRKEELQIVTDKLAAANVELKRLDQSKTEFISIASHQLRTPLTAIKGFVSLLLEGSYGAVPAGIADILNKIYTSNERIIHLVEDLLNISRMEAGRLTYEYAEVSVCEFLGELRDTFTVVAEKKGIELSFECPEGEALPPIWIDRKKSFEVVSNLIDNALKYTPKGSVRVRAERMSSVVRISISDTGVGIAPEAIPRLFMKFTRGEESGKLYANGTGLGLYVGKSMMEAQGGAISVFSEGINKGSTFSVDFPLKKG